MTAVEIAGPRRPGREGEAGRDEAGGASPLAEIASDWQHPVLGPIPPATFVQVAEEVGLIGEISAWVLERACTQVAEWRAAGIEAPRLSINLLAHDFHRANIVASMMSGPCSNGPADRFRREAVPGTERFDMLAGGFAMLTGEQRFVASGDQQSGVGGYVEIWQETPAGWQMRRVVSYDHRPEGTR